MEVSKFLKSGLDEFCIVSEAQIKGEGVQAQ